MEVSGIISTLRLSNTNFYSLFLSGRVDDTGATMRVETGLSALFAILQGAAALYELPYAPLPRRDVLLTGPFDVAESAVLKRSTHDATFPLNYNVANKVLFTGYVTSKKLSCHLHSGKLQAIIPRDISKYHAISLTIFRPC